MSQTDTKSSNFILLFAFGAFLLGGLAVYLIQSINHNAIIEDRDDKLAILQQELDEAVLSVQAKPETNAQTENSNQTRTKKVVVYNPGGLFPDSLRQEINKKFVNPFTDFKSDAGKEITSIQISNSDNSVGWDIFVIFTDQSYEAITYGNTSHEKQSWWTPICVNTCNFSQDFRSNYPEIVAKYQ